MADIRMSVVRFQSPTATGNFDVVGDLGGATPKAVLIFSTRATATGPTSSIRVGIGASDGTRQFCTTSVCDDNATTTNTSRVFSDNSIIRNVTTKIATVVSFSADTVTLNFSAVDAAAHEHICVMFGGSGLSAYCNVTGTASASVTGIGFEPDALLAIGGVSPSGWNEASIDDAHISYGCAINDGTPTQVAVDFFSQDAQFTGEDCRSKFYSNKVNIPRSGIGIDQPGDSITSFDADGFTWVDGGGSEGFGYLALNFGGASFDLVTFQTPTSTGNASVVLSPAFEPVGVIACLSAHDTLDQEEGETPESTGIGFCAFTSAGEQGAVSLSVDDDADPTNANMSCNDHALMAGFNLAGPEAIVADFVSMNSDGWTLDYSAVNATAARYGWALAFGPGTVAHETFQIISVQ